MRWSHAEIDDMGEHSQGLLRRAIAEASYRFGQEMEAGDRVIVGVNAYQDGNEEQRSRSRSRIRSRSISANGSSSFGRSAISTRRTRLDAIGMPHDVAITSWSRWSRPRSAVYPR